jgi:hypothetical protein
LDTDQFYRLLFAPLEEAHGTLDVNTLVAIIGFDAGGPLNFCTFNANSPDLPTTYVSCELAQRVDQVPSELGRYELLATCAGEAWVRSTVTDIARMSLEVSFGHGHTLDRNQPAIRTLSGRCDPV